MKLLAIDTSLASCSVALLIENQVYELHEIAPQQQTKLVLSMIDGLFFTHHVNLKKLDAICFTKGPGNFTGARIGAAVTQGLAISANLCVIPVSTLQLLAQVAFVKYHVKKVCICLNAHMNRLYYGQYQLDANNIMQPLIPDQVILTENLQEPNKDFAAVGDGWNFLKEKNTEIFEVEPRAGVLITLGQYYYTKKMTVSAIEAIPVYLQDENIWRKS